MSIRKETGHINTYHTHEILQPGRVPGASEWYCCDDHTHTRRNRTAHKQSRTRSSKACEGAAHYSPPQVETSAIGAAVHILRNKIASAKQRYAIPLEHLSENNKTIQINSTGKTVFREAYEHTMGKQAACGCRQIRHRTYVSPAAE